MRSTFLKPALLITFILFSVIVNAQQFDNPYQGNVIAASINERELKNRALEQVLVKVSGNSSIGKLDETKQLLKRAQNMLSQYGFRKVQGSEYFSAVFDKRKINQALKEMQQPVWGDTRPTTLIWLINNDELVSDHILKESDNTSLSWSLQQTEMRRGIRLQFPLMDLDDNLALSVSDVRGRFYDQVANASERYSRRHFVLAELKSISSDKWRLSWQLIQSNNVSKQNTTLINEEFLGGKSSVTNKMVNAIADYYAGQYAILENQGEKFTQMLHINGIDSLAELTKLNSVLKSLFAIASYKIVAVEYQQVSVEVKINGGLNSFKNTLIVQPNLKLDSSLPMISEIETEITDNESEVATENETLIDEDKALTVKAKALYFNWR
ncbi:MAG: DUF2066 domain-containing protein [Psychromonas sp.]|nr:DUF2066 domain-containing protein [Alteromonadales bacterium]MCP5077809.1 DUF2066 domain-containing protein [Psychromonas sp.]